MSANIEEVLIRSHSGFKRIAAIGYRSGYSTLHQEASYRAMSGDEQQQCVTEQSGSGATEHDGCGARASEANSPGAGKAKLEADLAASRLGGTRVEETHEEAAPTVAGTPQMLLERDEKDGKRNCTTVIPQEQSAPAGSGELKEPCPLCVVGKLRRRMRLRFFNSENRLTVAGLLRNSDFGLLPGHWTVREVLDTSHWIRILREGCNPAKAVEGIDFERMPVDWRPRAITLGCCPRHNKGVPGVGDECLDTYGGCEAMAMGTPHDIMCANVPCNVDLETVRTPPTPPPFDL